MPSFKQSSNKVSFILGGIATISSDILSDKNVHNSPISICSPK